MCILVNQYKQEKKKKEMKWEMWILSSGEQHAW